MNTLIMILEKPDFTELLPLLAHHLKIKPLKGHFSFNSPAGKGYCWAEKLPLGVTVLVSDTCLAQPISIELAETPEHHFVLQFNEELLYSVKNKATTRLTN